MALNHRSTSSKRRPLDLALNRQRAGESPREPIAMEDDMGFRDLIPWSKSHDVVQRHEEPNPFLTLHREMNRLFDDVFNGFGFPSRTPSLLEGRFSWPRVELAESATALKVTAELPGLEEKDVQVELANGLLVIRGERKVESEGDGKLFSERYYGSFERQIPLDGVQEDKAEASFRNGVLTVTLPKSEESRQNVKRIAINGR
jgi:HSP20 family protein